MPWLKIVDTTTFPNFFDSTVDDLLEVSLFAVCRLQLG